ncbi:MAG: hypothetical protein CL846_00640 [Crocinitomicaceae bacterium]|nr:hypothetical protein [Crocinitomicaceae bacterium]|tara:strand:- start:5599 stop:6054 length:456 start_codon:yes stop_codon:yes gene_type:complete
MKLNNLIKIFTLSFLIVTIFSCGKYEEGPSISLLPKNSRLQQKWRPIENVDGSNGTVTNIDNDGSYIEFKKGGTTQYYYHDVMSFIGVDAATGTWAFSDDKTQVIHTTDDIQLAGITVWPSSTTTYTITKLKINSLGLESENGDKTYYEYY